LNALEYIKYSLKSLDEDLELIDMKGKLSLVDCIRQELHLAEEAVWTLITNMLRV